MDKHDRNSHHAEVTDLLGPRIPAGMAQTQAMVDPVCGMDVNLDPQKAVEYSGQTYYFCSEGCMNKRFIAKAGTTIGRGAAPRSSDL